MYIQYKYFSKYMYYINKPISLQWEQTKYILFIAADGKSKYVKVGYNT